MARPPSFILFITDQQRADFLGCYGHPVVKTPYIDALAAAGTRMDAFHVASPVCMPNRASLLTGRYPCVHGLRRNGQSLSLRANTFVDVLRAAGYATALTGKSHLQNFTIKVPPVGANPFAGALISEAWKDDGGDYEQEQPQRYAGPERFAVATPYYGFDHVDMVTDHGDTCGGHYRQWLREICPAHETLQGPDHQLPHAYSCPQAYRTALPEALHPTAYVRERAIDFLRETASTQQPFFLNVSFPDPHHPFCPPGRYWSMYAPADFTVPLPYEAHRNPPPHLRAVRAAFENGAQRTDTPKAFMASEPQIREAMALTAGMVTMIDDAVGAIMETLAETGRRDDTVVLFNADHGDYLGDFQLMLKGPAHTRSVTRVPFIWHDPGADAVPTSAALASTVDIAPTILARAGLAPYNGIQGQSLLPVLRGEPHALRDALLVEHEDNAAIWGFDRPAQVRTLVTSSHRLSVYAGVEWGELYDLDKDPGETYNLWDLPACQTLKAALMRELLQRLMHASEASPWPTRTA